MRIPLMGFFVCGLQLQFKAVEGREMMEGLLVASILDWDGLVVGYERNPPAAVSLNA